MVHGYLEHSIRPLFPSTRLCSTDERYSSKERDKETRIDPFFHVAIASVVMAKNYTLPENMSAGLGKVIPYNCLLYVCLLIYFYLGVGAIVFFLGITRTIHLIGMFTPVPVIRGLCYTT